MNKQEIIKEMAYWANIVAEMAQRLEKNEEINYTDFFISVSKFQEYYKMLASAK